MIHLAACPWWDPGLVATARCTCPRPWRVRRNRNPRNDYEAASPWLIQRRMGDDTYLTLLRAASHQGALDLVGGLPPLEDTGHHR